MRLSAQDYAAARAWELFAAGEEVTRGVRPDVLLSWHRSRDDYSIDPARDRAPLAEQSSRSPEAVVVAAELGAAAMTIAPDVSAIGGVVAVGDGTGRILSAWGEPRTAGRGNEQNLGPWFSWQERAVGTTGIGLALESRAPVLIRRSEHWCSAFHDWCCAAVTVRDPATGDPVGVLDISVWNRALPERALTWLARAVGGVERRLRERMRLEGEGLTRRHASVPRSDPRRVVGLHAGRMVVLPADEVEFAEFSEGLVWLVVPDRRIRAAAENLVQLQQRLPTGKFVRVNRQVLVNVEHVREIVPSRRGGIWVVLDHAQTRIRVARRRLPALRRALLAGPRG